MNKLVGAMAFTLLTITTVAAQGQPQLYTRPTVPPEEALSRLNLKLAWQVYVPTEGRRDGLFRVLVLDQQILVQTRGGVVMALDPATGATRWRVRVGMPYLAAQPVGFNSQSVFVVNGARLYALERTTGVLQWELTLPGAPTAPPTADEGSIYVPVGEGRLYAYELPKLGPLSAGPQVAGTGRKAEPLTEAPGTPGSGTSLDRDSVVSPLVKGAGTSLDRDSVVSPLARGPEVRLGRDSIVSPLSGRVALAPTAGQAEAAGLVPQLAWTYPGESRIEQAPVLFEDLVILATHDGAFVAFSKSQGRPLYRLPTDAVVSAPLGQHGGMAYAASRDFNVNALDISLGKILWRATTGAIMFHKPEVTDEDVYVATERLGLARIKRLTGETVWRHAQADRFLAANGKFVYATDRSGRLLILDRARGMQLAVYDTRDFVVPISNEWTDRLYLASNDGLLLCLHDRAHSTPLRTKTSAEPPKPANGKPPAEKSAEK